VGDCGERIAAREGPKDGNSNGFGSKKSVRAGTNKEGEDKTKHHTGGGRLGSAKGLYYSFTRKKRRGVRCIEG